MQIGDHITLSGTIINIYDEEEITDIVIKTKTGRVLEIDPEDIQTLRPMGKEDMRE